VKYFYRKKKLLVIASTFPRWKNDTNPPFVYELSKRLTSRYDVTVLAPAYPGAKEFEKLEELDVYRFHYFIPKYEKLAGSGGILPVLKKNGWYYFQVPFFMIAELIALNRLILKIKPDVIHAHWIIPQGIIAAIVSKMTNVPYVLTTMGGDIYGLRGSLFSYIKKAAINKAKALTVLSNDMVREIQERLVINKSPVVVPLGVDTKLFNPEKYDNSIKEKYDIQGLVLLFVGRLAEKKGVRYLIDAMRKVVDECNNAKLLIIGDGPLESELKQQTKRLNLIDNVFFLGAIQNNELPNYYATADIFIGPSIQLKGGDTEGLGVTFIEALSSGCLTIATNVGGIGDIIKNGDTGIIVREQNSQDIAEAIINYEKKYQYYGKLKDNGLKLARKKFDWNIVIEKYIDVLDKY
jgi:glycosyltransferase involved in cell wall biosynthesis